MAQTTYTNRATFTAAAGAASVETFAGCGTSTVGFSGSLSSTSGPCAGILPGVTYSPASGSLYIAGPAQAANPTTALGLDLFSGDPITIAFAQTFSSFGVDLFQNFAGGGQGFATAPFAIGLFLGTANVGNYNLGVAPRTGSFFGITGTTFDRVTIAQSNGYAVIDNVSFGSRAVSAAVPEPATWGMMLLGLGAMGYSMRRRAKVSTSMGVA